MGYENGKTYWIVPRYNTNVALSVYGNTQVSQNRNVVVWDKQEIADQLWRIDVSNGYARIKSEINDNYALNIWLGSDKYGNCDIHTWSDNTNDSKINFKTIDASQNLYLIQCYRNEADNNLYLTAESTKSGSNVKWAVRDERANQIWQLCTPQSSGGSSGEDSTSILNKDTTVPSAVADKPFIITNIPDKQQASGFDMDVEFHPGCGFSDGTNFNTSAAGTAVKKVLQKYIKKVFGSSANLTDAQTCYYLYGERIANGTNQQFHPGVDINYYEGAPIYALYGGTVVYSGGTYGTVSIRVPSQNNIVTNYIHMKNIPVVEGQTVNAGQIIGYQSNAGVDATHLHFEIRPAGSTGPAGSSLNPRNPLTTIRPYGYMAGE